MPDHVPVTQVRVAVPVRVQQLVCSTSAVAALRVQMVVRRPSAASPGRSSACCCR